MLLIVVLLFVLVVYVVSKVEEERECVKSTPLLCVTENCFIVSQGKDFLTTVARCHFEYAVTPNSEPATSTVMTLLQSPCASRCVFPVTLHGEQLPTNVSFLSLSLLQCAPFLAVF